MFTLWIVVFGWLKQHMPTNLSRLKARLNFITLHYTYMICMTIIGSIIFYTGGNLAYVDALFFASGAATQSGLNTVDVNKLRLYQQITIMFVACFCNPIFINTIVVFVRLYWFEKRFQNVVLEARSMRQSRTRSRTKSEAKADIERDLGREEHGLAGREIVVLRVANGQAKGRKIEADSVFKDGANDESEDIRSSEENQEKNGAVESSDSSKTQRNQPNSEFHRDIVWADEVHSSTEPLPERNKERSIAFVENQRNPQDKGTFRIPGPRDYDRGLVPERIKESEELNQQVTNDAEAEPVRRPQSNPVPPVELNMDDHPLAQRHITIDAPGRPRLTTCPSVCDSAKSSETETLSVGMHLRNRTRLKTLGSCLSSSQEEAQDPMPYLSWTPTVGRNSAFVDLTEEQREELGGIEYRALKLLAIILVCYYIGFHLLGMIILLPWIVKDQHYSGVVEEAGISPLWWGFFTPASLFNDLGYTLTPDSMVSFQFAVLPLVLGTYLIIIGNTGFPCMLRFIIWLISKIVPYRSSTWEELRFLLDHPRRCFTLLFPSTANWWLFWVLILLNGIDLIFFIILDLNDPTVLSLPPGFRFLCGLFQAAATRTAGFSVVSLADLHPAIQISYLIMMYISIFPIAISLRQTNVYEEKSLGVWSNDEEDSRSSYLGTHLRRQLSFDLWYVFLGFFLIAIIEGSRLENTNEYAFTLFAVLFEIVSAYGTVGLSLGYPGVNTSFSGEFKTLSKLIIIAMELRGRHRGLPYALDRAILLPSEALYQKENEDATRRARRGSSAGDLASDGLMRTGNGLNRRPRNATGDGDAGYSGRIRPQNVGRFLSGALSAGPSIPRDKMA